jgi:DNA helicase II / ATP-dependent DNA helicase PcrA
LIDIINELNNKQYLAAAQLTGPLLIIAGAGSGKTRMITYRIAHMLGNGIHQSNILALTFTNKAAREMEERVKNLTNKKLTNLTVSTFHAFGVKILKESISNLGYKDNFSIYDQTDKISAIKEAARELNISPDVLDIYEVSNLFSSIKTSREVWNDTNNSFRPLYNEYQEYLFNHNSVDFDDLIILPVKLLTKYPEILKEYQLKYQYIMVDEFQDTSLSQYQMIKQLAKENRNICVVGDDDQSIYSWRGANYQNIINFETDFPELTEIKLEQNYRSTENILSAANSLISNNTNRKEKELWTGIGHGKSIELYYPENETREADFISEMIKSFHLKENLKYHDFAVLIRTNNLSTIIENSFLAENIPYKVSGGQSFFQRKEIKDIIAYLRVLDNPDDDVNFLRILNTPRRGLGKATLLKIREIADKKECSLHAAATELRWTGDSPLSDKIKSSLQEFIDMIQEYRDVLEDEDVSKTKTIRNLIDIINYWGYLIIEHQKNEKLAKWKYKNIGIFMELFEKWEKNPDNKEKNLGTYLNRITLLTRDDEEDGDNGQVNLMTIHASKGLEFEYVFLAGVENNIIPHARSIEENPDNIEEERRLFYVAITRAKQKLFMTSCKTRKIRYEIIDTGPSPFLTEIPKELIEFHKPIENVDDTDALDYFEKMKRKFK